MKLSLGTQAWSVILLPVFAFAGFTWFSQWREGQTEDRQREEYITWVVKYRPGWSDSQIVKGWEKIQYGRDHANLVKPIAPTLPALYDPVLEHSRQIVGAQ